MEEKISIKKKRELATSFTTLMFIVVGITGIMMFFHILDRYIKEMHEILGLAFCVAVIFHVIYNFNSMRKYFTRKIFIYSAIVTVILSVAFVAVSGSGDHRDRYKKDRGHYSMTIPDAPELSIINQATR